MVMIICIMVVIMNYFRIQNRVVIMLFAVHHFQGQVELTMHGLHMAMTTHHEFDMLHCKDCGFVS